ncbi:MAG: RHS repeat-associated core domain-containing protein, partial [Bacteroidales bacterium]|nr:RHS repeat-associated core domain-containing protein [Bacteroidales bacterium]
YSYTAPGTSEPYGVFYEASASGLQTGHWSRTLGEVRDSSTVGPAVMETWYYDDHGRVVYHVKGYPSGRRIAEWSGYDFVGNLTAVKRTMHDGTGAQEHTEEYAYQYDNWGRLQNTVHTLDGGTPMTLASNSYDSVGRLSGTQRGRVGTTPGPAALSSGYTYNVRGWLTGINGPRFSETLTYETPRSGSTQPGQWGGNISSSQWRNSMSSSDWKWYDYGYDLQGRLTQADYGSDTASQGDYTRSYAYDLNGNMTGREYVLYGERWTHDAGNAPLSWIRDEPAPPGPPTGLRSWPPPVEDVLEEMYTYDANGSMMTVLDEQGDTLRVTRYNLLNMPMAFITAAGDTVNYVYSADGEKLYVEENPSGGTVQGTEYAANYRIENGAVTMIHTDAGYYTRVLTPAGVTGPLYTHIWYLRDHLGNNRVLADGSGAPVALHDYDPFGEEISVASSTLPYPFPPGGTESPYKYGGKEWSATTSTYDFEARQFSPSFHRFTTMDPLAEKYYSISPYAYCANDPVNMIDPNGLSTHTDSTGRVLAVYNDDDLNVYMHGISADDYDGGLLSSTDDAVLMGTTEYWDEFISPETHKPMTNVRIRFGFSFDSIVSRKATHILTNDLVGVALGSLPGGPFDVKKDYPNTGGLLKGKYVTSRSVGNYLAGFSAANSSALGYHISFETFQKLAGALHLYGKEGLMLVAPLIITKGTSYGEAPTYGENEYQYRQSLSGWNAGYIYRFLNNR